MKTNATKRARKYRVARPGDARAAVAWRCYRPSQVDLRDAPGTRCKSRGWAESRVVPGSGGRTPADAWYLPWTAALACLRCVRRKNVRCPRLALLDVYLMRLGARSMPPLRGSQAGALKGEAFTR